MESQESSVPKLLGDNVQKLRKKNNLTQIDLAEKVGISQKHLSDIETGTKFPSAGIIEKLSQELNVQVYQLFGGSDTSNISTLVINNVLGNILPKINTLTNDVNDIKSMLKNLKVTIQTEDDKFKL